MKTKFTKKGRRILSAALCLLMMITALPMSAFAWTSEEGKSCTSSFGDYYVGSDGEYYRSKATYSFIVYDSKGNITVQSINAGNAKRKYLMTDNSGTHQVYCVESGVDFNTGNSYVSKSGKNGIKFSIGFSEHPAFYDRQFNDRYTDLSFALGNYLLGVLDEKQHRERESKDNVGWYHKTDFEITATIGGEDFHYEGRFDIGDGEGDLISHIKNFYEYSLSPNCPFIPEWKKQGEDYYREQIESLQWGRDVFVPYLEQHKSPAKWAVRPDNCLADSGGTRLPYNGQ